MIRATTPVQEFQLPFALTYISDVVITYAQDDEIVLEKSLDDCTVLGSTLKITLTQEETLMFGAGVPLEITINVLDNFGSRIASTTILTQVEENKSPGVMA